MRHWESAPSASPCDSQQSKSLFLDPSPAPPPLPAKFTLFIFSRVDKSVIKLEHEVSIVSLLYYVTTAAVPCSRSFFFFFNLSNNDCILDIVTFFLWNVWTEFFTPLFKLIFNFFLHKTVCQIDISLLVCSSTAWSIQVSDRVFATLKYLLT